MQKEIKKNGGIGHIRLIGHIRTYRTYNRRNRTYKRYIGGGRFSPGIYSLRAYGGPGQMPLV